MPHININNFFSNYIINPLSSDLSYKEKWAATILSILLVPFTLGIPHIMSWISLKNRIKPGISSKIDGKFLEKYKLIKGTGSFDPSQFSWLLNLGLLKNAFNNTNNDQEKKQISFLASNFLNKAAPVHLNCWKNWLKNQGPDYEKMFQEMYQVAPFDDYWYHRESLRSKNDFGDKINQKLALGSKSPFILTDTIEFSHLFPLKFRVFDEDKASLSKMEDFLDSHFKDNPLKALDTELNIPFLIDVTEKLGKKIKIHGDSKKEKEFDLHYNKFKINYNQTIDEISHQLIRKYPELKGKEGKLKEFINKNVTCLARIHEEENIFGIKILPINNQITTDSFKHSHFLEFMHLTGIYTSAIELRRHAIDAFALREDINYGVPSKKESDLMTAYYLKKDDFTSSCLFQRLASLFDKAEAKGDDLDVDVKQIGISKDSFDENVKMLATKPHFNVLGKATMDLLKGLINEISLKKWTELNQKPAMCQILQSSLFMIKEHLAMAEQCAYKNDFTHFSQEIELIHAQMATLLEIINPFKEGDFEPIYKEVYRNEVPHDLQNFAKGGLGKTAMNVFSGINAALMSQSPHPQRVYGKNVYYEETLLVGENLEYEKMISLSTPSKVDLYVGQFNPNVCTDPSTETYSRENIIERTNFLLKNNKAADHLTVAIDLTIEQSPSKNVKDLLNAFKNEIKDGRLNFIFFKSGQKFDMLGMDNYYGAPFYMVNNGGKQWKEFDALFNQPVHKTDSLSLQWFCLSNKYAKGSLSKYKELIFKNTREILDNIPLSLRPNHDPLQSIRVNSAHENMDACFIDIKHQGPNRRKSSWELMKLFYKKMKETGNKLFSRQSFGFCHPSYLVFDLPDSTKATTTRLTPGINPEENKVIVDFFNSIN